MAVYLPCASPHASICTQPLLILKGYVLTGECNPDRVENGDMRPPHKSPSWGDGMTLCSGQWASRSPPSMKQAVKIGYTF